MHEGFRGTNLARKSRIDRLFNLSNDLLCVAGFDGYFKQLNPAWETTLGWTRTELKAKPYLDFVHPEDRSPTLVEAEKLAHGENVVFFQNRYRCKDGSYKWLSWKSTTSPKDAAVYAIARDDTDRKKLETEIRANEAFLNSVVENVPNMIFVKDANTLRFVRFNRAGEELLGIPRAQLLGKNDHDLFPRSEADFFTAKDRLVLQQKSLLDIPEEPLDTKAKGTRILHTKKIPILDERGEPRFLLGISEDITEQRKAGEDLKRAFAQLKELEASRLQLVNNIAHDLNTPLTPIKIQLHLLSRTDGDPGGSRAHSLQILRRNVEHLQRLILDLKEYARLEAGQLRLTKESVPLDALVKTAVESFRTVAEQKGLRLASGEPPKALVHADGARLTQVLYNLLNNAVKFTPAEGTVQVESGLEGAEVWVRVTDSGRGLNPDEIDRLFQPFTQVHDPKETPERGTGLGLYIAKGIVEGHEGRISCESPGRGRGSTFTFTLPLG